MEKRRGDRFGGELRGVLRVFPELHRGFIRAAKLGMIERVTLPDGEEDWKLVPIERMSASALREFAAHGIDLEKLSRSRRKRR